MIRLRYIRHCLAPIAMAACISCCVAAVAADFDPRTFGAKADGLSMDTRAIQAAVDACAAAGGGTVRLSGGVFLSGAVVLKSNIVFMIEAGAILRGSRNIDDYRGITPGIVFLYRDRFTKSLLYAERAENVTLCGRGAIDGQGEHFPFVKTGGDGLRPYLVRFSECKNVRVRDLTLLNSARWLSHYLACEDVGIDGVTIRSRIRENRDGMDIDSCNRVRIANCDVYSGDDAIVLKATAQMPCRHVTVTNCTLSSIASALKLGTESNGGFEDINFSNCSIYDTGADAIDVQMVDGGVCQRVNISNITIAGARVPICVRLGNRARPIPGLPAPGMGRLRDVVIANIQATATSDIGCSITGIAGQPVEGVTVSNVRIRFPGGGTAADARRVIPECEAGYPAGRMFGKLSAYGFYCRHAKGLRLENVDVSYEADEARPGFVLDDVQDAHLTGCRAQAGPATMSLVWLNNANRVQLTAWCPGAAKTFVRVDGSSSRRIMLWGNDLADVREAVELGHAVPADAVQRMLDQSLNR